MLNIRFATPLIGAAMAAALATSASAATVATATTPLNIRSGPGPQYSVTGVIPAHGRARITGCIEGSLWCRVIAHGKYGWAYSRYLSTRLSGHSLIASDDLADIPAAPYEAPVETVGSAVPAPVVTGALIAPTSAQPLALVPPAAVTDYINSHPLMPVYLSGEVVKGAGLPQSVALARVPGYDYQYADVDHVPVLVNPSTRTIAYVYR